MPLRYNKYKSMDFKNQMWPTPGNSVRPNLSPKLVFHVPFSQKEVKQAQFCFPFSSHPPPFFFFCKFWAQSEKKKFPDRDLSPLCIVTQDTKSYKDKQNNKNPRHMNLNNENQEESCGLVFTWKGSRCLPRSRAHLCMEGVTEMDP